MFIENEFGTSFDAVKREVTTPRGKVLIVYMEGLVDKVNVEEEIIRRLLESAKPPMETVSSADISAQNEWAVILKKLLSGDTLIFSEGDAECVVVQTRGWMSRGISPPETQRTVRGPKEGFTETMLFNVAMIRRRIRSTALRTEVIPVGRESRTDVCVMYMAGKAKKELVSRVTNALKNADVDYILDSGQIEQLLSGRRSPIFPTAGSTERPDVAAAKLLKGKMVIIVDGTPFVLTLPYIFVETLQAPEDYYVRSFTATSLRLLRFVCSLIALVLPGLYTAVVTFHPETIPDAMLFAIAEAAEGVPLSAAAEIALMLALYELVREAMVRLPVQIGGAVSIAGVFIIGDAAVAAGIISAPAVVVAALSFMTTSAVYPLAEAMGRLRLLLLGLGAAFGAYGVFAGMFSLFVYMCSLDSFGTPYLFPITPLSVKRLGDSIVKRRQA